MKKILLSLLLGIYGSFCFGQERFAKSPDTYNAGELLVMLEPSTPINTFLKNFSAFHLATVKEISTEWNIWKMSFDKGMDAEMVKKNIAASPYVKIVQFNHNCIPLKSVPNDTLFPNQWDMEKISAPAAWSIATGGITVDSQQIVVATVDQGFDLSQPDVNYWINTREIPNNGIDDDSNGYVDDYRGWNVVWNNDSMPLVNHGTFCAGISGAIGNNTQGVAGVCWNVKEMVVATNTDSEDFVVSAYSYVFRQRQIYNQTNGSKGTFVVVTNSSFGPAGYGYDYPLWNAMYDSLGSIGILNAGATSNDPSCNTDTCPDIPSQCSSDYTIMVTNTDSNDIRRGGYGPLNVDIAALGSATFTTLLGDAYGASGGTSSASPHVAGAIALMWSAACKQMLIDYQNHPDSLALLMKQYLLESVDTLPSLVGKIVSGGRLNLYKALLKVQTYDCTPTEASNVIPASTGITFYPSPCTHILNISSAQDVQQIEVYNCLGQLMGSFNNTREVDMSSYINGTYILRIITADQNCTVGKVVKQ